MKTFKDLFIRTGDSGILEYIERVTRALEEPWERAYENEENSKYLGEIAFSFTRKADSTLPAAGLSIFQKDSATWYVPNVVPVESGKLSYDEYNSIISEFYDKFLEPVSEACNIGVEITSGNLRDEDIVGENAAKLLSRFSKLANKSSGSSHPMDRERWFAFVVEASKLQFDIDTGNLKRLLVQQGWSEESALDLVIEFEFGVDLIRYMER